ncbi:hypothetical protein ACFY5D_02845 [Paeniglutamicibacter sp. NPDC012692]|uniref:hypothetical protein n=1 Tax=Paeniglutamicibacter sp. NPDC012692 TaxID=3364388 RepID=UPI00368695E0
MVPQTFGLLAILTGVATAWLVNTRPSRERDPDAKFWYGFTGYCVVATLLLIAASQDRWVGALSLAVIAAGTLATGRLATCSVEKRAAAESDALRTAAHAALVARHDSVLRAWGRYALDPAAAIDFPAMNDVHVPEVSGLAKALAEAELLRRSPDAPEADPSGAGYHRAIDRLEAAFRRAEQAAADPARGSGTPSPAGATE